LLSALGAGLVAAGVLMPAEETLLVAWGGTALFGALLLVLFGPTPTVRADVATDVYTALAANCREAAGTAEVVYRHTDDGIRVSGMVPTGTALVDRLGATESPSEPVDTRVHTLVDGLVEELELATRGTARVTDGEATVTVRDCRFGTQELFDHPVASVLGVGLARKTGSSVNVGASAHGDELVVTCVWSASQRPAEDGTAADAEAVERAN
jgi:hypothetical protein